MAAAPPMMAAAPPMMAAALVAPYRAILRYYRCDTTYRAILFQGGKQPTNIVRYPPPWYLISHRHICAIPHFATYRVIIVRYPIKTSTKKFCRTIATSIVRYEKYRCWASKAAAPPMMAAPPAMTTAYAAPAMGVGMPAPMMGAGYPVAAPQQDCTHSSSWMITDCYCSDYPLEGLSISSLSLQRGCLPDVHVLSRWIKFSTYLCRWSTQVEVVSFLC